MYAFTIDKSQNLHYFLMSKKLRYGQALDLIQLYDICLFLTDLFALLPAATQKSILLQASGEKLPR